MSVPPPADVLAGCLRDFERFLNDLPDATPPLPRAALAHVQFETIHPFSDGNGFVEGIEASATQAVATAQRLLALVTRIAHA